VLVGFKAGIGLVIVVDQIPKLLGIHFAKGSFPQPAAIAGDPETQILTLIIGVTTIVLLVALERFVLKVPAPLVVMALGIAAMSLFGLRHEE
jgi:MFS superfamily sulfate permease-like transporter